ncbi:hypothetical protein [Streptomyces swartbergensis]|uniref:hypothetical protein n=1 Tax=Streptomyces swartbergensis TaxID=487165 RepID=UPI0038299CE1
MRTRAVAAVALAAVVVLVGAGSAVAANDPDPIGADFYSAESVGDDGAARFFEEDAISGLSVDRIRDDGSDG